MKKFLLKLALGKDYKMVMNSVRFSRYTYLRRGNNPSDGEEQTIFLLELNEPIDFQK